MISWRLLADLAASLTGLLLVGLAVMLVLAAPNIPDLASASRNERTGFALGALGLVLLALGAAAELL